MIFVCYARENRRTATRLETVLGETGFTVLRDAPRPESNPFWRTEVRAMFGAARVMVVLWSHDASMSPWVDQEHRAFDGHRIWFRLDATPLPCELDKRDAAVSRWAELKTALSRLIPRQGCRDRILSDELPEGRRAAMARGREGLTEWRRKTAGARTLRNIGKDALLLEDLDMRFQKVRDDVYLAVAPMTGRQYAGFVADAGVSAHAAVQMSIAAPDLPIVSVSWFEAQAAAEWCGGVLPSEQIWQRAAAADRSLEYATASGALGSDLAWFGSRFGDGVPKVSDAYPPNPAGFYGMSGNTWDWCGSQWDDHRVIRGGSWMDRSHFCTVSARYRNAPVDRDCTVGFRVSVRARQLRTGVYETFQ